MDSQQQILARLGEHGLLKRKQPTRHVGQEPADRQSSEPRAAALMVGYAVAVLGVAVLTLLQASGSDTSRSYQAFFGKVFAYVVRESWAVVREKAVPIGGNPVIAVIFVLGVFKALELAVWIVRKLWPALVALGGLSLALVVLMLQAAQPLDKSGVPAIFPGLARVATLTNL